RSGSAPRRVDPAHQHSVGDDSARGRNHSAQAVRIQLDQASSGHRSWPAVRASWLRDRSPVSRRVGNAGARRHVSVVGRRVDRATERRRAHWLEVALSRVSLTPPGIFPDPAGISAFKENVMSRLKALLMVVACVGVAAGATIHASRHDHTLVITMTNDRDNNEIKVYDADSHALLQTLSTQGK